MKTKEVISEVSNDANSTIEMSQPYVAEVEIQGTAPFIFHRWSCDDVEAKGKAAKNSKAKKTDNLEAYVWRDGEGELSLPGEYVRQSMIHAAKYKQDPRSPRKSAMDLFKAGLIMLNEFSSFGTKDWDYVDKRRVVIQRNGVTRLRPTMLSGWKGKFQIQVILPEYIEPQLLHEVLINAGRLVGVGDFRPTFGRFQVTSFQIQK